MLMELLAAIALGFGAAGLVMLLRRFVPGLPRPLVPVAAGLGMLGFAVWSEYSWFDRTAGSLPDGIEVVSEVRERSWRPWSWAWPHVTRFAAVNAAGARRNPAVPGQVMADTYLIARHAPPVTLTQLVDCPGNRRAELTGEVAFADDGRVEGADWRPLDPDDPLHRALCGRASAGG